MGRGPVNFRLTVLGRIFSTAETLHSRSFFFEVRHHGAMRMKLPNKNLHSMR